MIILVIWVSFMLSAVVAFTIGAVAYRSAVVLTGGDPTRATIPRRGVFGFSRGPWRYNTQNGGEDSETKLDEEEIEEDEEDTSIKERLDSFDVD